MNICVSVCPVGIERSFVCPLFISLFVLIIFVPKSHDSLYLTIFCFRILGLCLLNEREFIFEKPESSLWIWNPVVFRQLSVFSPLIIHD